MPQHPHPDLRRGPGNAHFPSAAPSSAFMKKASVCAGSAAAQSLHEHELQRLRSIWG